MTFTKWEDWKVIYDLPDKYQNELDHLVKMIEDSPDGFVVTPDGRFVHILSSRPTEITVMIEVNEGENFNDVSTEEIRAYIRRKLDTGGLADIEF
jgi:hypothetical protein